MIIAGAIFVLLGIFLFLYFKKIRPWQLHWGASETEILNNLPGDDIVKDPSFDATRSVTIQAPAAAIYPWIPQMGVTRAGWYSYDLLDNLGRHSAETILQQFQNPAPGTVIPMSPDGKYGLFVKEYAAGQWMLWWDKIGNTSWVWQINPQIDGSSRLITRVRVKYRWLSLDFIFNLLIEFFDIMMMRKCMLEIKRRAEQLAGK